MGAASHIKSTVSLAFIVSNLLFWIPGLVTLALLKLTLPSLRTRLTHAMSWIYRRAVVVDDWWLQSVLGLTWNQPCPHLDPRGRYIVLCNHRSWSDTFLVQSVITHTGPIINFLIKRELIFIPIIGLILWAYEFPVLRRRSAPGSNDQTRRERDRKALLEACAVVKDSPAALMIFAEGTRFSEAKRRRSGTSLRQVLPPRSGGFTTTFGALKDDLTGVIDLTLVYREPVTFWQFLTGGVGPMQIDATVYESNQLPDNEEQLTEWLLQRWQEKDQRLSAAHAEH